MKINRLLCCLPAVLVAACVSVISPISAQPSGRAEQDLQALLELLVGEFDNEAQIESPAVSVSVEDKSSGYSHLTQQRQIIKAPELGGVWLFSQISRGGVDGEVYRQSYLNFYIDADGVIYSRNFKLKDSPQKPKVYPTQAFLEGLKMDQLTTNLPSGCDTKWTRQIDQFTGTTDHQTCVIDSKYKDERRRIFSEEIIAKSGMWGREGGYRMDGELAFGLLAPNYYKYSRVLDN